MHEQINCPRATVFEAANTLGRASSEALYGEYVEVLDERAGLRRVRLCRDDYTGWISADVLQVAQITTHRVVARSTLLFSRASIKSPVVMRLPFGAELALRESDEESMLTTHHGLFVWRGHVRPRGSRLNLTPVDLAARTFAGAPYLWGGRTPDGCDCSGLVQSVVQATGGRLPRDSPEQEAELHGHVPFEQRRRGDLVFWAGHVGLLADANTLFHATAHTLTTLAEPLADVIDRAGPPCSIKRLGSGR